MIPAWSDDHVQALEQTINTLRAERDEARREVCDLKSWNFDRAIKPEDYALLRKWGCFPPAT
jgi:ABC-type phosphate/phosphonate transport system substrate-binding protein